MSIILDHINYCYSADSAYKVQALKDVSLEINDGEFIGIIGHTGSGKSTLIQHMNGLLKATSGHIYYNGQDIYDNDYDLSKLRHKVGMVFQYPEHQLFETTIFDDVCFGPRTRDFPRKRRDCGRLRHCAVLVCRRSFITSRRLISREGRSAVWRSPECLP